MDAKDAAGAGTFQAPLFTGDGLQVAGGTWAFIVTAMQTYPGPNPKEVVAAPVASLSLSWPLAKALHQILGGALDQYETLEGRIELPKSFLDKQRPVDPNAK